MKVIRLRTAAEAPMEICVVCLDSSTTLHDLGCRLHLMCAPCIAESFSRALKCEADYPPRCCRESDASVLRPLMFATLFQDGFLAAYDRRVKEYETRPSLRMYCARQECNAFFVPDSLRLKRGLAQCELCLTWTCPDCKIVSDPKRRHRCKGCPLDHEALALLNGDVKTKRCPECRALIEWRDACSHMTCYCRFSFCFICLESYPCGNGCDQYHHPAIDEEGYDEHGFHKDTGLDKDGFSRSGFDEEGYNRQGRDRRGFDRNGYDPAGYDMSGLDREGFNRRGYDAAGLDRNGQTMPGRGLELFEGGHVEDGVWFTYYD